MGKEYAGDLVLASKGIFYKDALSDGVITVEPWGSEEERLLVSPNIDFNETLDRLIKRLTNCPIPPSELLLVDRHHIFLYMRCLSYGGEYSISFKCESCGNKVSHDMDLEKDLDVRYADDPDLLVSLNMKKGERLSEPFRFTLPIQKKVIGWRMLRGKDEDSVKKYVRRIASKAKLKKEDDERPDYIYRSALRVVEFDGHEVSELTEAMDIIKSLRGKDSLAFRQEIEAVDFGIDTELVVSCRSCGYPNELMMPLDKTFFRPRTRVAVSNIDG
jgi:hypothetical protein